MILAIAENLLLIFIHSFKKPMHVRVRTCIGLEKYFKIFGVRLYLPEVYFFYIKKV